MHGIIPMALGLGGPRKRKGYLSTVLNTRPANLLGYWPLDESAGTVAYDQSGNARHGSGVGMTVGQAGIGDGRTSWYFDGANDYGAFPADMTAWFNPNEGTLMVWLIADAALWAGVTQRVLVNVGEDTNNRVLLFKSAENTLRGNLFRNSVATTSRSLTTSSTAPLCIVATWSVTANVARVFVSGAQLGADTACPDTYVGGVNTLRAFGSNLHTAPSLVCFGKLAHLALWNAPLTAAEVAALAVIP